MGAYDLGPEWDSVSKKIMFVPLKSNNAKVRIVKLGYYLVRTRSS